MPVRRATFGCGCFWGIESVFGRRSGVLSTASVYAGRLAPSSQPPVTYPEICDNNRTTLAEAVSVEYDDTVVSFQELLDLFWASHDETSALWTRGTGVQVPRPEGSATGKSCWQYRSEIFAHDETQHDAAEESIRKSKAVRPVLTVACAPGQAEIYVAEAYHQKYLLQQQPELFASLPLPPVPEDPGCTGQFDEALLGLLAGTSVEQPMATLLAKLCGLVGAGTDKNEAAGLLEEVRSSAAATPTVVRAAE